MKIEIYWPAAQICAGCLVRGITVVAHCCCAKRANIARRPSLQCCSNDTLLLPTSCHAVDDAPSASSASTPRKVSRSQPKAHGSAQGSPRVPLVRFFYQVSPPCMSCTATSAHACPRSGLSSASSPASTPHATARRASAWRVCNRSWHKLTRHWPQCVQSTALAACSAAAAPLTVAHPDPAILAHHSAVLPQLQQQPQAWSRPKPLPLRPAQALPPLPSHLPIHLHTQRQVAHVDTGQGLGWPVA